MFERWVGEGGHTTLYLYIEWSFSKRIRGHIYRRCVTKSAPIPTFLVCISLTFWPSMWWKPKSTQKIRKYCSRGTISLSLCMWMYASNPLFNFLEQREHIYFAWHRHSQNDHLNPIILLMNKPYASMTLWSFFANRRLLHFTWLHINHKSELNRF